MSLETVNPDILSRLFWAVAITAASLLLYRLLNRVILARAHGRKPGLELAQPGRPILLYFTTPACAPCKTVQRPAIQKLIEQAGERLQLVEIDATARPEVASQWGVLSVPTTFIIDSRGRPRYVNHGVTSAKKLLKQFERC